MGQHQAAMHVVVGALVVPSATASDPFDPATRRSACGVCSIQSSFESNAPDHDNRMHAFRRAH
jgi:hypothetical protein